MVKIRLRRMGARNRPYYRIVVSDSRLTARAEVLEELGSYDPVVNPPPCPSTASGRATGSAKGALVSRRRSSRCSTPDPTPAPRPERRAMKRLIETVVRRLSDHPDEGPGHARASRARTAVYEIDVPEGRPRPPDRPRGPHRPRAARLRRRRRDRARQARPHPRPRLNGRGRARRRLADPCTIAPAARRRPDRSAPRARGRGLGRGPARISRTASCRARACSGGAARGASAHADRACGRTQDALLLAFEGDRRRRTRRARSAGRRALRPARPTPSRAPEGFYYSHEIRGWRCEDAQGRPLGAAAGLEQTPAGPLLSVDTAGGKEALVPFVHAIVVASTATARAHRPRSSRTGLFEL